MVDEFNNTNNDNNDNQICNQVSWLRPRENEILTVGRYTYVGDPRFTSINEQNNNDWILEIKDVTLNDSTSYECQVSTDPKMSLVYNLHVKGELIMQSQLYSITLLLFHFLSLSFQLHFSCLHGFL